MNVEKLERVRQYIKKEGEGFFDMHYFGLFQEEHAESVCGLKGCIAGTALFLEDPLTFMRLARQEDTEAIERKAQKVLGLSKAEANRLFFTGDQTGGKDHWPDKYTDQFESAGTAAIELRVVDRRIKHFIATKGKE